MLEQLDIHNLIIKVNLKPSKVKSYVVKVDYKHKYSMQNYKTLEENIILVWC